MAYSKEALIVLTRKDMFELLTPKGKLWSKLLNRLPMKYWDRIGDFAEETDLIDGCKYILTLDDNYSSLDYESIPVKSVTEAIEFIKLATKRRN